MVDFCVTSYCNFLVTHWKNVELKLDPVHQTDVYFDFNIYGFTHSLAVAKTIVDKTHKIDGCNLEVKLYVPPKPRPTYDNRLLITGIKNTTTKDCLINYLEAKSSCEIEESNVFYGEDEGTAVVYFKEMPGKCGITLY